MLATRLAGEEAVVVFRDGEAPPPLNPDVWRTERLADELREARVKALPAATTETLEALLEEP